MQATFAGQVYSKKFAQKVRVHANSERGKAVEPLYEESDLVSCRLARGRFGLSGRCSSEYRDWGSFARGVSQSTGGISGAAGSLSSTCAGAIRGASGGVYGTARRLCRAAGPLCSSTKPLFRFWHLRVGLRPWLAVPSRLALLVRGVSRATSLHLYDDLVRTRPGASSLST